MTTEIIMIRFARPNECPIHGAALHRDACRECNAAYMRGYLRRRARERPGHAIWERARRRAARLGVPFALPSKTVLVPEICPVLDIPLTVGVKRAPNSPSLDRIVPRLGYVPGNVRVISDRANRIKGSRALEELRVRAGVPDNPHSKDYARAAAYLERELLLQEVRAKAAAGGRAALEWEKVAVFLDRAFSRGPVI